MTLGLEPGTLVTGLLVFAARVADVSLGTLRTISIVQSRTRTAFFLGLLEITMWLAVIATVLQKVSTQPILGLFYALGFSFGNVAGIWLEKRLAFGDIVLRVICAHGGAELAQDIRADGFGVTVFHGEGMAGPVIELFIACRRRDLQAILRRVQRQAPQAFYITEPIGAVHKFNRPMIAPSTGWRSIGKKK